MRMDAVSRGTARGARSPGGGARRHLVTTLAVLALAGGACSTTGYLYKVDKTIRLLAPTARSTVRLPVTVTWVDEAPPTNLRVEPTDPTAGYYAVFIDRSPLPAGKTLASLAPNKNLCRRTPGCPDEATLRRANAVLTAEPHVVLQFLADLRPTSRGTSKDPHEVTIVRMRGDQRIGEAAFRLSFFVRR